MTQPTKQDRKNTLKELDDALRILETESERFSDIRGGLMLRDGSPAAPIGLIFLGNPRDPQFFHTFADKFSQTDFELTLPFRFSNVLYRLSSLNREVKKLNKLVMIDGLTGMYNLRFFERQLEVESKRSQRYGPLCALILFDLDHFKRINDCYGHPRGNQILKEAARRILEAIRKTDFAARYGGEEFAVLLPSTDLRRAVRVAERIRRGISDTPFDLPGLPPIVLTISGGVAEFSNHFCASSRSFVSAADKALYQAKRLGRNRIGFSGECPEPEA